MLELILDRECHNGKRPERLGPWHWRFEARGDTGHYCYYFHSTLRAAEAGVAIVDVAPDQDLLPDSAASFRPHRPETVWLSRGRHWERHRVEADAPDDTVRVRVAMNAGEAVSVSRMRPSPYSAAVARVQELAENPEARAVSLGRSARGREIAALEVGTGSEQLLVLAGQHPAEFGGTQAVLGNADWLLSSLEPAQVLHARYRFTLFPVLNPDGNVEGRCGHNARGVDLYRAFPGAANGVSPEAEEAACLWQWVETHRPALSVNFHTFTQPSPAGDFPWEGLYTCPDELFPSDAARQHQRQIDDALTWETAGLSQHGGFSHHVPGALESQLAAREIPSVFYELQDATGPHHQCRTAVHVLRTALQAIGR
jgi:hypothetical protein